MVVVVVIVDLFWVFVNRMPHWWQIDPRLIELMGNCFTNCMVLLLLFEVMIGGQKRLVCCVFTFRGMNKDELGALQCATWCTVSML